MKRIVSVDADTGEVVEGVVGVFFPRKRNGFYQGWVAMSQGPMMALATANIGEQAHRVLWAVLARLDFENYLQLVQSEIADELGMKRPDVNTAIKRLEKLGVLLRGPKAGRSPTFRVNPNFGWKGTAANHQKALRERMEAANIRGVIKNEDEPEQE